MIKFEEEEEEDGKHKKRMESYITQAHKHTLTHKIHATKWKKLTKIISKTKKLQNSEKFHGSTRYICKIDKTNENVNNTTKIDEISCNKCKKCIII